MIIIRELGMLLTVRCKASAPWTTALSITTNQRTWHDAMRQMLRISTNPRSPKASWAPGANQDNKTCPVPSGRINHLTAGGKSMTGWNGTNMQVEAQGQRRRGVFITAF